MNSLILLIILVPIVEIYLFIKIGSSIGALNTVLLIFLTAFVGIYYARAEGLNTLNQGIRKMIKNEMPAYELISGAFIAIGAIFLIIPGFATDILGFLLIFPLTRKFIFSKFIKKIKNKENINVKKNFIDGEFEDIEDDDDRKI